MGLKQWLTGETIVLTSPLPIAVCVDRLRGAMADGVGSFPAAPVRGAVDENWLQLVKVLQKGSQNSFQTYLRATLRGESSTTRLACRIGPHPLVIVFTLIWLAFALAIAIVSTLLGLKSQVTGGAIQFGLVIPFLMIPMGIAILGFGRFMARNERQFLLDFLRDTIEARSLAADRTAAIERVGRL
jgi:hypothetical protein